MDRAIELGEKAIPLFRAQGLCGAGMLVCGALLQQDTKECNERVLSVAKLEVGRALEMKRPDVFIPVRFCFSSSVLSQFVHHPGYPACDVC